MIEYYDIWLNDYKKHKPNSIHIINDATKINYIVNKSINWQYIKY
jgi:hypothetical protein